MVRSLIPREERFYDMFIEDASNMLEAARTLSTLMTDYEAVIEHGLHIRSLEHRGDELSREIGNKLATTFVTPFDREDIHGLINALDDVVDIIEKTSDTFVLYHIGAPSAPAVQLASIILQECESILEALTKLRGFKDLKDHWVEIHRLESEGDRVSREAIAGLFAGSMDAVEIIKWKDVYELLEDCCDRCEDVADIIEKIVVKHA
jgi:predicted phosphate transport protein (TIGR00153 family)